MADYVLELMEYSVRAALLLFLCKDSIVLKEKYRSVGKVLFFLQAFIVSFWLSNSTWVNKLIYGDNNLQNSSSYSIVKIVFIILCSFVAMDVLYQGGRLAKIYLLSVFYTVQEMVRFSLHSFYSLGTSAYLNHISEQLIAGDISSERFYELVELMQFCAMLFFFTGNMDTYVCGFQVVSAVSGRTGYRFKQGRHTFFDADTDYRYGFRRIMANHALLSARRANRFFV